MADTQEQKQKYFLDLSGLTTLWNKIKTTFADKEKTEGELDNIKGKIDGLGSRLDLTEGDVDAIESTISYIAPREVDYYQDAVEASKTLSAGTLIKVNKIETSSEDPTPSGYATGIYVVLDQGEIKLMSISDGDAGADDITAIGQRVETLENTVVKSAQIIDHNGNQLGQGFSVADNVLLIAHDDVFDIDTNSVKALTHRAVAAKFKKIEQEITQIPKFKIAVVDELPDPKKGEEISLSTIYLKKSGAIYNNNLFEEWIYVETTKDDPNTAENESKYTWEKLGEQSLIVDDIVTHDQLNGILSNALSIYAKTADVQEMIQTANADLKLNILADVEKTYATIASVEELEKEIEGITGDLSNYLTKDDAAANYLTISTAAETYLSKDEADMKGWMTEADIINSIQLGNIGNAIIITTEQIENMIDENQ